MEPITIERDGKILAHHTTQTHLSHYGQPAWVIEDKDPEPGPAIWRQGSDEQQIDVLGVKGGWLIIRQPDGPPAGIIWSDGNYYADLLEDAKTGEACSELAETGQRIRGTVQLDPDNPEDLGAILF
jgi:hypothetical protein